ncbi:hypothetical protein ES703_39256 [subsurface metagenome]
MLIFYILLILANKKYRPKWNVLLITITIFTGLYVLTSITGINLYRSFWGTLERMGGVFSFLHYWIFFMILVSVFRNKEDWLKFLKLSIVAGFLSILFAYGQYFKLGDFFVGWQHGRIFGHKQIKLIKIQPLCLTLKHGRIFGTQGNAALFAGYLIFILFLAIYFLSRKDISKKGRIFYGLVLVLGIPALFLTAVRGTIISFLIVIFLLGIFNLINSKNTKIKQATIIFIGLLIIIISIFWFNRNQPWIQENQYLQRITDISLETRTVQTRLAAWKSAWQGWQERFVLGWGPENFNLLFAKYFDPMHYEGFGSEVVWDRAHNTFLNTGATMGIVGLLSYLSIFVVLIYYFIRAFRKKIVKKLTLGIFSAMLIAYIGHNMFIFDSFNSYLMFFIILGYLSFLFGPTKKELEVEKEINSTKPRIALLIVLALIMIFTIYKTAIIPAKANYAATRGIVYGRSDKHLPMAFNYFRKSLSYNAIQTEYEVRHHLARMVFRIFSRTDNPQELGVKEEDIAFAVDEAYKNTKTDSLDPIPYLYTARLNEFLSRVNQEKAEERLNEAEQLLNKAKSLNEKNPYIYFELGQVYIFRGELKKAIEFFDQGISIKPDVELGYWYKGVTYLDIGEIKKGEEFIKEAEKRGYKKSVSDIHRLLRIYTPLKDYPAIIELYLEAIELEPMNAQFYTSLATAYKENKEIDKAIETARKVGELDPELKPEADAFIHMLETMYK